MFKFLLNLRAFDGEGGSAAAAGNAGAGDGTQAAAENGAQNVGSENEQAATATGTDFDTYIQQHQQEADKWFQGRFQEAFNKRYAPVKKQLNATKSVMEMLAQKYGIDDAGDVQAITRALENDDALYAERAEENGRTIEEQRNWDMLERENRMYREQQQQMERSEQIRRQMDEWDQQSKNLKIVFPDFDLDKELQNPQFEAALRGGLSIQSAFYAVHGEEIAAGAMQNTAAAVRNATVQDMAAKKNRPKENAIGAQASAKVSKDVHKLTKQERADIARRSIGGPIRF